MDMRRFVLKNIGPIKYIDIELNKINVIIGPQSSGKSTIAKIVSFCSWLEKNKTEVKRLILKGGLVKKLEEYHRLKGYFSADSAIYYRGDNVTFVYNPTELTGLVGKFQNENEEKSMENVYYFSDKTINPKVSYIPAERNFVAALPNARKYAESDDNLLSFIEDWLDSKRHYPTDNAMDIMNLGVKFCYSEKNDRDFLMLQEKEEPISLEHASSGLQSLIPLTVLINWFANGIYEQDKPYSPEEIIRMKKILADLSKEHKDEIEQQQLLGRLNRIMTGESYTHTQFIIEEPEQNLYPKTQVDFLYFLLAMVNHGRPHRLVLTTHSPYVLYALNNCLLAYKVKDNMDKESRNRIDAIAYAVNPESVSVWQIKNGYLCNENDVKNQTIQDVNGLIRKNYFNSIMKQVMGDFNELLNFYE